MAEMAINTWWDGCNTVVGDSASLNTVEEIKSANASQEDIWLRFSCLECGGLATCYNRTVCARCGLCFWCLTFGPRRDIDLTKEVTWGRR